MNERWRIVMKCVGCLLLAILLGGLYVILKSHCWPSETGVRLWLILNGVREPVVQVLHDGKRSVRIMFPYPESARTLISIPNIVSFDGSCDIDLAKMGKSPRLQHLNVYFCQLVNQEELIHFPDLVNVIGCIDAPFKNPVLVERNRKWHLALRATEDNLKMICEAKESEDYDLEIDDSLLKKLSKSEMDQLRNSRYRYINSWRRDFFFENGYHLSSDPRKVR